MSSYEALGSGRLRILVTGAAGLVGRELCGVLAGRGHAVVALLHCSRTLDRNDGMPIPARLYDGTMPSGTVAVLGGDVTAERFGLAPPVSAALSASLDLIVHCAAVTAFNRPNSAYERVNIGGTAQVLAFAKQPPRPVPLLHVSTAYVCGTAEGVIAEALHPDTGFNNGYEASKAAAEALVIAAHRRGHPVAIARPAIVAGDWATGAIGAFGGMYQLIRLIAEGRLGPLPAAPGASLNLVPIDHVVASLTDIAERMKQADGRIFHLAASHSVALAALAALAADFPHLQAPHFMPPGAVEAAALSPRQQWLHVQVTKLYACYLRPSPEFVTANLDALSGRICPLADTAYLQRLIRAAIAAGFLPAYRTSG